MSAALAAAGWLAALGAGAALLRLRARMEAVGDAAHELRGSAAAMGLAAAAMRREPGGLRRANALESEMARMRAGLADLDTARGAAPAAPPRPAVEAERALRLAAAGWRPAAARQGRQVTLRWDAGPVAVLADRGRLAQMLGNLLSNAIEHGTGPVRLTGRRRGSSVVLEVADGGSRPRAGHAHPAPPDRGRGLGIAARAAEEAGGRLAVTRGQAGTTAAVELPVAEG